MQAWECVTRVWIKCQAALVHAQTCPGLLGSNDSCTTMQQPQAATIAQVKAEGGVALPSAPTAPVQPHVAPHVFNKCGSQMLFGRLPKLSVKTVVMFHFFPYGHAVWT
jgi:hypothetical protein